MQAIDLSKPGEKKKLIWAALLGLGAILVLWWVLFGFGSGSPTTTARPTATPTPQRATTAQRQNPQVSPDVQNLAAFTVIDYRRSSYEPPDAQRNIFAYYVPPPKPSPPVVEPSPTPPPPPPPVLLASLSPANVYARTADFKLEVAGDKFTPQMHIFVDGRELPTTYKGPQQLFTTIPASFIAAPGQRQVVVRTSDNQLFSNPGTINVAAPPTPENYTYIGIISPENRVTDTALVQERGNKNVISVYRGDVIGGRFRVTSISEKELVLVDTNLKIKHTLKMSEGDKSGSALSRPTPRVDAEDDEP